MSFGGDALVEEEVPQGQFVIDVEGQVLEVEHKAVEVDLILYGYMDVPESPAIDLPVLNDIWGESFPGDQV